MSSVHVWIGSYGEYVIPDNVFNEAKKLNGVKKLTDQRTRGFKRLERWGKEADTLGKKRNKELIRDMNLANHLGAKE